MLTRVPDGLALARGAGLEDELVAPGDRRRLGVEPRPAAPAADRHAARHPGRPGGAGPQRPAVDGRALPGAARPGAARRAGRATTSASASSSAAASARRSSSGSSTRCSAASTPAAPTSCRCTRRCRSSSGPAARHRSLLRATLEARAATPPTDGPLFASLPGGLGRLPAAVARASGAEVRLRTTVRALRRTPTGWELTTGSAADPRALTADAVVLAVPGPPAARLLADVAPAGRRGGRRPRVRQRRARHARARRSDAGHRQRLPRAGGRGPHDQGRDLHEPQVARTTPADRRWCAPASAAPARRATCSAPTPSSSPPSSASCAQAVGPLPVRARQPRRALGRRAAAVRRRSPRPGPPGARGRRPAARVSPSPGRRTTGSACRPSPAADGSRPRGTGDALRQDGRHERHVRRPGLRPPRPAS